MVMVTPCKHVLTNQPSRHQARHWHERSSRLTTHLSGACIRLTAVYVSSDDSDAAGCNGYLLLSVPLPSAHTQPDDRQDDNSGRQHQHAQSTTRPISRCGSHGQSAGHPSTHLLQAAPPPAPSMSLQTHPLQSRAVLLHLSCLLDQHEALLLTHQLLLVPHCCWRQHPLHSGS